MATLKTGILPWGKRAVDKETSRLQFTPVQQGVFVQLLRLERRRTQRSGKPFLLVLVGGKVFQSHAGSALAESVADALAATTRETDVLGWYERGVTLGLIMTEIGQGLPADVKTIVEKVSAAVLQSVGRERFPELELVFRIFPEEHGKTPYDSADAVLYPDITKQTGMKSLDAVLKRTMDIIGSLTALLLFFPVMAVIAVLVKLTSEGPVFFCQKRMGRYGKEFSFLKFRTMYVNNDPGVHRDFVLKLIDGSDETPKSMGVYKLVNDRRVTPLGRILRRTSLDELPQFLNVLKDDMSLVGPRPPLPYEYERYRTWHKRRVLELKPGITGLWQVKGRSRISFEDMVRLDLRYANMRSLWLDLKIIFQTPWAMISGNGAC